MNKQVFFLLYSLLSFSLGFANSQNTQSNGNESMIHHLSDIQSIHSGILLDIRYATPNNFLGFPVYPFPKCYLQEKVAKALSEVQNELDEMGLRLKVFDGYRPLFVQQLMWDTVQDERYVSNPAKNFGRHTRGTAVDLTLVDLMGQELEMPTAFDDFTEKAHSDYSAISDRALANRQLLKVVMENHGFIQFPFEWWHFDYNGWENSALYPPLNVSFEELESSSAQ